MIKLSDLPTEKPLTILCHREMGEEVVNDRDDVQTIDCFMTEAWARDVTLRQWDEIKQMPGFIKPFRLVFGDLELPDGMNLQSHGAGVRHIAGLIALTYDALFHGKRPFWVRPETHLHPSNQTGLADLMIFFMNFGKKGQPE